MRPDDTTNEHLDTHLDEHLDDGQAAVRFEQVVDLGTSIESAWAALSNPDELAQWLGSSVELEVQPGGRGRIVDDDGTVRDVLVTAVDELHGISWHWWSDGGDLSSVELRLDEHDGRARLHIVEMLVPTARDADARPAVVACSRRWTAATARLWRHVGVATFA